MYSHAIKKALQSGAPFLFIQKDNMKLVLGFIAQFVRLLYIAD